MKTLFFLLLVNCTILFAQEDFVRGVYVNWYHNVDYTQLRDSLNLNYIQSVVDDFNGNKLLNVLQNSGNLGIVGVSLKSNQNGIYISSSGQRMVFEAEQTPDPLNLKNYFNERNGIPEQDTLWRSPSSPGYMVKSPVPNNEYNYKRTHYTASFILKRTPAAGGNPPVVRLEAVCMATGSILAQRILYNSDFASSNLETKTLEFNLTFDAIPSLKPMGVLLGKPQDISSSCNGVDIRVYWYGNVTTWLDKVIVEDDIGKSLFSGLLDNTLINNAQELHNYQLMKRFYLFDEPFTSSFLSYKYVNDKTVLAFGLDTLYGKGSGITAMNNYYNLNRFLLDAQPRDILIDPYSISALIPTPSMTNSHADSLGITIYTTDNYYNTSLQNALQSGFIYGMSLAAAITIPNGTNFYVVPQLHGDYFEKNGKFQKPSSGEIRWRPPTGNEVSLQCNLAIARGAKGLIPYPLTTERAYWDDVEGYADFAGLLTPDLYNNILKNHWTNYAWFPYQTDVNPNQQMFIRTGYKEKWDALANFYNRLKNMSVELMSLKWQNAFSIHLGQPTSGDISNVQSYYSIYKEGPLVPDEPATTYIELGLFKLKTELTNPGLDYFYVVNRRTLPDNQRVIRVTINKGGSIFTNWKVTEIGTGNTLTINKTGSFQTTYEPGEGKLFKLEPVMLAGGNIVYNENVPSGTTLDIKGTIIVNQGATLTLNNNSTFNFHYYKSLINNGSLIANLCTINFFGAAALGSIEAPSNWGIRLEKNSTSSIGYIEINDARTGIFVNETSTTTISNCVIRNSSYSGIDVYRSNYASSQPVIFENLIYNTLNRGNYGVSLTYSSPSLINNVIYNFDKGIYCINNSSPNFGSYGVRGNNTIAGNLTGIYAYANSNPYLGSLTSNFGGNNAIRDNSAHNIYAYSMCNIMAENNWWGSNPPNTALFFSGGKSSIDYTPWMTNPPTESLLEKNDLEKEKSLEVFSGDIEVIEKDPPVVNIMENILLAKRYIDEGKYLRSLNICRNIINEFPDTSLAFTALDILWQAGRNLSVPQLKTILRYIYNNGNHRPLFANAGSLLAGYLNTHTALLDSIISRHSGQPIVETLLLNKFLYQYYDLDDTVLARMTLNNLDLLFPESESTLHAHLVLGDEIKGSLDKQNLVSNTIVVPDEYEVYNNYPNPFNPTTTIKFDLPNDGLVQMKVYDILGNEVATLVNEQKVAGRYEVNFNASTLASGVYIYKLQAGDFVQSKKMILLK